MKLTHYSIKLTILSLILFIAPAAVFAQKSGPRQEKLLNGLKVLMWNEPRADKVSLRIRINSGSAFDPQQKEGVMQLLADSIFPNEGTKEFFTEELGGSLDVTCNYDYIQINATSQPDKLVDALQTLANAITNPTIDKETTARLKAALLIKVGALEKDPAYIADRAAAKRLFGTFPYGRPQLGSSESIKKIEYQDLLEAKQRFLMADNAAVALSGSYNSDLAFRAIRRYLGAWLKSDKKVPSTFRQPDPPPTTELRLELPDVERNYVRRALSAPGRNAADYYAAQIAARSWRKQLCLTDESKRGELRYEVHLLRGIFTIARNEAIPTSAEDAVQKLPVGGGPCSLLLVQKDGTPGYPEIGQSEFDETKAGIKSDLEQSAQLSSNLPDMWLDVFTFGLGSVSEEMQRLDAVTLADVKKAAEKLQKEPNVMVMLTRAAASKPSTE